MSKAGAPRWRYVAVRLHGSPPVSRRGLANAVKGRFRSLGWPDDELPQLTRFEWPYAIVRIPHHRLADARAGLPRMDWAIEGAQKVRFHVETLLSSGTIKTLTERLGVLGERSG